MPEAFRPVDDTSLPACPGLIEDYTDCTASCGLDFHVFKAGTYGQPLIFFCHGFPELAFSWRKVMPHIADAAYYCVAMDQRGYGRTRTRTSTTFEDNEHLHAGADLSPYAMTNLVRDLVCLVYKLGYHEAACIVGHDFGAMVSSTAALVRPDIFKATVQMSHPTSAPQLGNEPRDESVDIEAELSKLDPPRKHYKWYNSSAEAAGDWITPPQGLDLFLRGYFHLKSAEWHGNNRPRPLAKWGAEELSVMPEYYVMNKDDTMPGTVAKNMQDQDYSRPEEWLPMQDLQVYVREWQSTGFQAALNWYRAQTTTEARIKNDMPLFAGRRIEVPCAFISGKHDWGNHQQPGALEGYQDDKHILSGCFWGVKLVDNAGHWVQQE